MPPAGRRARLLLATVMTLAACVAACGLEVGASGGDARVLVTRDFGARAVGGRIFQQLPASETVAALLRRGFRVRPVGWSVYVNGIERAPDAVVHGGDRIWWDRHDRSATAHVPAVVGSFPEPLLHGSGGKRFPVVLQCADDVAAACSEVAARLAAVGIHAPRQTLATGVGQETLRVVVGPWREVGGDAALGQIDRGPSRSGVYARFTDSGSSLALLDARGAVARTLGAGAGLIAATRFEEQAPTWTVTGTDPAGVMAAAHALDERRLTRRFALAVRRAGDMPLPVAR